jgi:hypothetical protein
MHCWISNGQFRSQETRNQEKVLKEIFNKVTCHSSDTWLVFINRIKIKQCATISTLDWWSSTDRRPRVLFIAMNAQQIIAILKRLLLMDSTPIRAVLQVIKNRYQ